MDPRMTQRPWDAAQRSGRGRHWKAGAASALAAALLAGGGIAVALESHNSQPQAAAAGATQASDDGETLASLTSLDSLGPDVAAVDTAGPQADLAQTTTLVTPAAATPSPSASAAAKHPARTALRRVLAVIIRQNGTATYGQHAQTAARAAINRFPAAFRRLPEKLRQDLWTLAGAPSSQTDADAQNIRNNALNGTYGAAVQKLAQAIEKAPAKPAAPKPSTPAPSTPTPSPTTGS